MVGPGPGRQAPSAGPVGRVGCIWRATRFSAVVRPRVYPPRRARAVGAGAASPRFTGCAAGPVCPAPQWRARPHHISLAGHTVRSPTSRAVAHRYHVDAVHADHAAYPTVPPSPPPHANAHPPVEGVKLAGWSGGQFQGRRTCIHRPRLPVPQALDSTVAYLGRSFPKFVSLSAGLAALLAPPRHVHPRTVKSSQLVLALLFGHLSAVSALATNVACVPYKQYEALLDFSGAKRQRFLHCAHPPPAERARIVPVPQGRPCCTTTWAALPVTTVRRQVMNARQTCRSSATSAPIQDARIRP